MVMTLQLLSIVAGFAAAAFWLLSSLVKIPEDFTMNYLANVLRRQSRLSSYAAILTGLAVLLQTLYMAFAR
jgi:hypothetical protein